MNSGNRFCARLLSGAAIMTLAAFTSVASAETADFSIPPQPLDQALKAFGAQSGHSMMIDMELVRAKTTQGIMASSDPETALRKLLAGTGLSYKRNGDIFAIIAQAEQPVRVGPKPVVAAAETVSGSAIEGLVVTAQKRRENIQDVPIAISAFSQDQLEVSQIAGGPDLMTQVPNMTFTKTNFSGYSIQIRGIGTQAISATTDPAVSVSHNNTSFIRNRFFEQEFYDLERVEVLRGPQGTLYGRNATAGVVNLITAKPSFDYETKTSLDLGNFQNRRVEAMVNLPLVEDKAALRFAGAWTSRDGYATNEISGDPIDGRDLWSTRLSLRLSPADNIDANVIWEHFEEEDDRLRSGKQLCKKHEITQLGDTPVSYFQAVPDRGQAGAVIGNVQSTFSQGCIRNSLYDVDSFQTPNGHSIPYYYQLGALGLPVASDGFQPFDPYRSRVQSTDLRVIESTVDPEYRANSDLVEIQIDFDIADGLTLTSETAYAADTVFSLQDFNRFNTAPGAWDPLDNQGNPTALVARGVLDINGVFCDPQLGCSDRLVAVDLSTADSRTFSQEFRLSSNYDGPFNFSAGVNFLRYDTEDKYYVFINSIGLISAIGTTNADRPYEPGVTDGLWCQPDGPAFGDPEGVYPVAGCVYTDPNPIGSLNDLGHNYFLSRNPYKLISYAAFGEVYWNITDALKVTAGLRLSVDKKDAPRIPSWLLASNSFGYPTAEVVQQEWTEPSGRLAIDWKPNLPFTDDTLLYASLAHGYKAGGANPPNYTFVFYSYKDVTQAGADRSATRPKTFDPEFVDALEVGTKNTFLDGRLTANLAAFYYDYKDYQISEIVDRSAFNRNFDATVWGVEFEGDWQALENLRFGLKIGYEKTRIADGERAVDLMDRTAGQDGWMVVRPFPTFASNCILPTWLYFPTGDIAQFYGGIWGPGGPNGGNPGGCEWAYILGMDPVTEAPYVPNPTDQSLGSMFAWDPGTYPGFNPASAPNNGEGFFKELGGNELPNAPNWTTTFTADYTLPMGSDWTVTLHGDFYYQSEAWWRVFNDHDYNHLEAYHTINLAAILRNEDSGWNIMGYIKNVTDETAITGAFLSSDDTGLTTNVFLTEPRLYGVRVSKNWSGLPFWKSQGDAETHELGTPYLLTLELGGQIQDVDAPNETIRPSFASVVPASIDTFDATQNGDLDWGDGREIKLTVQPDAGPWKASLGARFGKINGERRTRGEEETPLVCAFGGAYASFCPEDGVGTYMYSKTNWMSSSARNKEEHTFVDFTVSRDVGIGGLSRSAFGLGVRYAQFKSTLNSDAQSVPDWNLPEGFFTDKYVAHHNAFEATIEAHREFEGEGPILSWDAAHTLFDAAAAGHVDLDWSVNGGVLFGRQKALISGVEEASAYDVTGFPLLFGYAVAPTSTTQTPFSVRRSDNATVPTVSGSLGLSYTLDRVSVGAGYRWERYYDVLDGGHLEESQVDRTIDGPYFKVAVGFGG